MSPSFQHRLEYRAARFLTGLIRLLPRRVGSLVGVILGQAVFSIVRLRREETLDNLRHAFSSQRNERELVRIGACCYRNLGRGMTEFCRFTNLTRERLEEILQIQGLEHIRNALGQGRGAILLSAHFGVWELLGPAFALNGFAVDLFVRTQRNPLFDKLMSRHRRWVGAEIIRASRTPRGVVRSLRQNRLLVILADQDGGRDGIFVPFMGRDASTPRGVARFAQETGAPVLMGFVVRGADGRYRLLIDPPMKVPDSGDREADLLQILETYTRRLESYVREHPEQWFWPHRRWKTRPPSEGPMPYDEGDQSAGG